jgi:hypothetical protein
MRVTKNIDPSKRFDEVLKMNMKNRVAMIGILSSLSFATFAADSINSEQAQNRQSIGTISVGAVNSSPMDMREMLNQKAQEQGATAYRVIEARSGDHWHATAELYK